MLIIITLLFCALHSLYIIPFHPIIQLFLVLSYFVEYLVWWKVFLSLYVGYFYVGIMSFALHRYFAHKSFKTSRIFQFILGFISCLANQNGPLWWASKHRKHHKYCDTYLDPHSPVINGFWYSFIGWSFVEFKINKEYIKDYISYNELYLLDRFSYLPLFITSIILYQLFGVSFTFHYIIFSSILGGLYSSIFNTRFHSNKKIIKQDCQALNIKNDFFYKTLQSKLLILILPMNNVFLIKIIGENLHKNHHKNPKENKRNDLDLVYYLVILPLKYIGLIWF